MKITTPEHKTVNKESLELIKQSARDFALQYIKPYVMDWDENQHFPKEVLQKAGEYGFMYCRAKSRALSRMIFRESILW